MLSVMKQYFKLFFKNKDYIIGLVVFPLIVFASIVMLLPYSSKHTIGLLNKTDDTIIESSIEEIEGISIEKVAEKDINKMLISGNVELMVIIDKDPTTNKNVAMIITTDENEIQSALKLAIENAINENNLVSVNKSKRGKNNLGNVTAFLLFKFLEGGLLLCTFIIVERKNKMRDRILISGIKAETYITGMSIVYLLECMLGSTLYYLLIRILNFDLGMEHPIQYLLMLYISNILSVSIAVIVSAFVNNENTGNAIIEDVILLMGFFAGIFFPYEFMPKTLQAIGSVCPQRWLAKGIEITQKTGNIFNAYKELLLLLGLSIIFYVIGILKSKKRTN